MKKSFRATFFSAFFFTLLLSLSVFAGECKVSQPSAELIHDALEMAKVNEIELARLTDEYEKKTGQKLQIVIVARAGQDLSDQTVLIDEKNGQPMSVGDVFKAAEKDPESYKEMGDSSTPTWDYTSYVDVLKRKFKDPKRKMEFSHLGFMIRNHPKAPKAAPGFEKWWRARHMLRPCENKNASTPLEIKMQQNLNVPYLFDEGSANFFADEPYELKARYIVPSPALQARLMEVLFEEKAKSGQPLIYVLNSRFYNAAASWQNPNESNSNQWVLEVLAAASQSKSAVRTREDAQDILARMNYRPTKVYFTGKQSKIYIPGARLFAPFVTYHSKEQPYYVRGAIGEVISALSVEEFMGRNGMIFHSSSTAPLVKTAGRKK